MHRILCSICCVTCQRVLQVLYSFVYILTVIFHNNTVAIFTVHRQNTMSDALAAYLKACDVVLGSMDPARPDGWSRLYPLLLTVRKRLLCRECQQVTVDTNNACNASCARRRPESALDMRGPVIQCFWQLCRLIHVLPAYRVMLTRREDAQLVALVERSIEESRRSSPVIIRNRQIEDDNVSDETEDDNVSDETEGDSDEIEDDNVGDEPLRQGDGADRSLDGKMRAVYASSEAGGVGNHDPSVTLATAPEPPRASAKTVST